MAFGDILASRQVDWTPAETDRPAGAGGDSSICWFSNGRRFRAYDSNLNPINSRYAGMYTLVGGIGGDSSTVWFVDRGTKTLYKLAPSDFSIIRSAPAPGNYPIGIGGSSSVIWHSDTEEIVYELSPTDFSVVRSAAVPVARSGDIGGDSSVIWHCDCYPEALICQLSTTDFSIVRSTSAPGRMPIGIGGDSSVIWHCDYYNFYLYKLSSGVEYNLNISTSGNGNGSVSLDPSGGTYEPNTVVELTATPNIGSEFSHWSGDLSGSDNPDTIVMDGNKSVTATFTLTQHTLSITVNPSDSGAVIVTPEQDNYNYGTSIELTANPTEDYEFSHWSGDLSGSNNPKTFFITDDMVITANFTEKQYNISTSVIGNGTINLSPEQEAYDYNTEVMVSATAGTGYEFSHWEGDLSGSSYPKTLIVDGDKSITAVFTIKTYTLSITVSPVGSGSVTKLPEQDTYEHGDIVQLSATPSVGYRFVRWEGDLSATTTPRNVEMDKDKSITAVFEKKTYTLSTTVNGSGSIVKSPNQATYEHGTMVELTAQPAEHYYFTNWSGDISSINNPETITMDSNKSVTCNLTLSTFTLILQIEGEGAVEANPLGAGEKQNIYEEGTEVTLTATADDNYVFKDYTIDLQTFANPSLIVILDENKTVYCRFELNTLRIYLTNNPSEGGTIFLNPSGNEHLVGTELTLTAKASPDFAFSHWSGDLSGSTNPETLTMEESDKYVTANYNNIIKSALKSSYRIFEKKEKTIKIDIDFFVGATPSTNNLDWDFDFYVD